MNIAKNDIFPSFTKKTKITDTDYTSPNQKGWNYTRKEDIVTCRSFINLSENSIEGTKKLEIFWGDVHKLFGELMVKGTKPGDSMSHRSLSWINSSD